VPRRRRVEHSQRIGALEESVVVRVVVSGGVMGGVSRNGAEEGSSAVFRGVYAATPFAMLPMETGSRPTEGMIWLESILWI